MSSNIADMPRWIKASIIRQLKLTLQPGAEKIFVEGEDNDNNKYKSRFEIRIDGPYSRPCGTAGEYTFYVEVNILSEASRNEGNFFAHDNMKGLAQQALNQNICIYRIGNSGKVPQDDGTLVGVMILSDRDRIKTSDFGQIDTTVELYAAVTEAHYEMYVKLST